ncbi:MAG: flagellar hook-associated protein FlgK [Methylothermaceae bacterium]|nr:flagellar hook-associated protein FlgK [Methylothermaceae bacterium]
MGSNLLDIATSALRVNQRALDTTGHNIANVNTEGYSRQRVEVATRQPRFSGAGYLGTGVETTAIKRAYDDFLTTRLRNTTSGFAEIDQYHRLTAQIDHIVADPDIGVASAMEHFFNAAHDVASDPTSIPARQTLLSEAETLADRFNTLDARLKKLDSQTQHDLRNHIGEINVLAKEIADLNEKIVFETGRSQGKPPNDLLDQRALRIQQLAEKIDVTTVAQDNGAVSVMIGNGQSLVNDARASRLDLKPNDLDPKIQEIVLTTGDAATTVTGALSGGEVGGLLRFREEVLAPTQNKLGRLAVGLAVEFNQLHENGYDLDGNPGAKFFNLQSPEIPVTRNSTGTGTIAVSYADPADLRASDYRLHYESGNYTLTRLSDQTQFNFTASDFPATVDGIQIDVPGSPTGPSTFLIRPTAEAAGKLEVALGDPRQVAAADAAGAVGNNGNALQLAALESAKNLLGGTATFQDTYSQMVAEVGTLTRSAEISRGAQETLKQQATQARAEVSGVNLDEEAANLVRFQQAYQAAAEVVSVASQTFDTLINAVRS